MEECLGLATLASLYFSLLKSPTKQKYIPNETPLTHVLNPNLLQDRADMQSSCFPELSQCSSPVCSHACLTTHDWSSTVWHIPRANRRERVGCGLRQSKQKECQNLRTESVAATMAGESLRLWKKLVSSRLPA